MLATAQFVCPGAGRAFGKRGSQTVGLASQYRAPISCKFGKRRISRLQQYGEISSWDFEFFDRSCGARSARYTQIELSVLAGAKPEHAGNDSPDCAPWPFRGVCGKAGFAGEAAYFFAYWSFRSAALHRSGEGYARVFAPERA